MSKPKVKVEQAEKQELEVEQAIEKEDYDVKIFARKNIEVEGLPAMFIHIKYNVPNSKLHLLPEDSYILC